MNNNSLVIEVPVTKEEMLEFVGEPCIDYEHGCCNCDAWLQFAEKKTLTFHVEREAFLADRRSEWQLFCKALHEQDLKMAQENQESK